MSVSFFSTINLNAEVNISNINAVRVLDALGVQVGEDFSERCCGNISAEDFLGRVLVAQALSGHDEGMPSFVLPSEGALQIQGARPEGYLDEVLGELAELASLGGEVRWS